MSIEVAPLAGSVDQNNMPSFGDKKAGISSSCTLSPGGKVFADDLYQAFLEQYPEFPNIGVFFAKFYTFCEAIHPAWVKNTRKRKPNAQNPTSVSVGINLPGIEKNTVHLPWFFLRTFCFAHFNISPRGKPLWSEIKNL